MPRIIAHIDMDAFYAAIEERDTPAFRGLPLVVGADPAQGQGRGVVSTANYKAREYGIYSATPISTAWRLSEEARRRGHLPVTFVSVDMRKYAGVSAAVMAIARRAIPVLEQASIDEAYGDVSSTGSFEAAAELCRSIKAAILSEERLTASVGIGPSKMIARSPQAFRNRMDLRWSLRQRRKRFLPRCRSVRSRESGRRRKRCLPRSIFGL